MRSPRFALALAALILPLLACSLSDQSDPARNIRPVEGSGGPVGATAQPTRTPMNFSGPPATDAPEAVAFAAPPSLNPTTQARITANINDPNCQTPDGWTPYVVVPGDTLFRLGQRTATDANTLLNANCLIDARLLEVGQVIAVPRTPDGADPNAAPASGNNVVLSTSSNSGTTVSSQADGRTIAAPGTVDVFVVLAGGTPPTGSIEVGCENHLVPLQQNLIGAEDTVTRARGALEALIALPNGDGYTNALVDSSVSVHDVSVQGSTATVALSGEMRPAGACAVPLIVEQLRQTALRINGVESVAITVNGEPIEAVLSALGD